MAPSMTAAVKCCIVFFMRLLVNIGKGRMHSPRPGIIAYGR